VVAFFLCTALLAAFSEHIILVALNDVAKGQAFRLRAVEEQTAVTIDLDFSQPSCGKPRRRERLRDALLVDETLLCVL